VAQNYKIEVSGCKLLRGLFNGECGHDRVTIASQDLVTSFQQRGIAADGEGDDAVHGPMLRQCFAHKTNSLSIAL